MMPDRKRGKYSLLRVLSMARQNIGASNGGDDAASPPKKRGLGRAKKLNENAEK